MKKQIGQLYFLLKNDSRQTTPYLSTILIAGLFLAVHIFLVRLIFNLPDYIFHPIKVANLKISNWLNTILFFTPVFIFLLIFSKKSELDKYEFTYKESKKWKNWFILYSILLFLLLIVFIIKKGAQKGVL